MTFELNSNGAVDTSLTNAKLLTKVKTGKQYSSSSNIIETGPLFGGSDPKKITQDSSTGANDIKSAKATTLAYPYLFGEMDRDQRSEYEALIEKVAKDFNKASGKSINLYLFSQNGLRESFSGDIQSDLKLVQVSITLVATYCIIFLGGCSPIHFRSAAAGICLLCVGLSFASS